jgi:hypothetical protein
MTARIPRLKRQLPSISPAAKSADCTIAEELIQTINSGRDVTLAINISPIHAFPNPVISDRRSP